MTFAYLGIRFGGSVLATAYEKGEVRDKPGRAGRRRGSWALRSRAAPADRRSDVPGGASRGPRAAPYGVQLAPSRLEAHLAHGQLLRHGDGVLAVEAGAAEVVLGQAGALLQAVEREVVQGGGADAVADLLHALSGSHQLGSGGHVDAVEARVADGRRADAQVHLSGAGRIEHVDDLAGGVAAHDGVVDHDQPLAADDRRQRVELHADAHLAQLLVRLDEGAVDVAVLDEALGVRDAGGARRSRWRPGCRCRAPV